MSEKPTAGLAGVEKIVPINAIRPNPWNPNVMSEFMFEKERASIREFGFIDPILVREATEGDEEFEIIDGEHRWKAAQLEGLTSIKITNLGRLSDAKAQQLTIILNETRGDPDKVRLAELVKRIVEADDAAVAVLPYDENEIRRMVEITDFDWSKLDDSDPEKDGAESRATEELHPLKFSLTTEQLAQVQRALHAARTLGNVPSDNLAIELICADYLSGAAGSVPYPPPEQAKKRARKRKAEDTGPTTEVAE